MRCLFAALVTVACLFSPAFAQTQTVDARAAISWTLPTQSTTGTALTGTDALQKVQLWVRTASIPDADTAPTVVLPGTPTTYQWTGTIANGSTLYVRAKACNAVCGAMTPQMTRMIQVAVPNVPDNVAVTVTVTLSVVP